MLCGQRMTATIHLCFQKRHWRGGYLAELRDFPYCVVSIPRDSLHRYIHEWMSDVPAPRNVNAKSALLQLRMLEGYGAISENDSIEKRLRLLIALFDCVEQPTADAFRKQLDIVCKFYKKPSLN